jgi:CheY-like chemotaxis protein
MPLTGCTILEVDDYEAHNYVLSRTLENAGPKVLRAYTGAQALALAGEIPDAIVLDIKLPDINGFEVCRRLRANAATRNIPVIFVTAVHQDCSARDRADLVGGNSVLFFPVEGSQLVAVIQGHIAKAREHS